MKPSNAEAEVVNTGTFLYATSVECDIRVIRSSVRYGSGDQDDPPEVANDIEVESYYVEYGSTTQRGVFSAGSTAFSSLQEAILGAAEQLGPHRTVHWQSEHGE